jgi:hypothetical protein
MNVSFCWLLTLLSFCFCMVIERRKFSPPQVAKMFGVAVGKVKHWITTGELRAINVADGPKNRPRYMIDIDDIKLFEAGRRVVKVDDSGSTPSRKLARRAGGVIKQFV